MTLTHTLFAPPGAGLGATAQSSVMHQHAKMAAKLSPLTVAVHVRQTRVVRLLLRYGANPLQRDDSGLSPYDRALLDHAEVLIQ